MLKKLLRHSTWILLAQSCVKVLAFGYTLFLARNLGVDQFGLYTFAVAFFLLINAVSDFGLSRYLIKTISGGHQSAKTIPNILVLRLLILSGLIVVCGLAVSMFESNRLRTAVTLLALVTLIPQAVSLSFENLLVARQKFNWSAVAMIVSNLLTVLIGVMLVSSGYQAIGAVMALFMSQVVYTVGWLVVSRQGVKGEWLKQINRSEMIDIFRGAMPYGLLAILGLIYFRVDTLMLTYLRGSYETGIYALGYKFLEGVIFIPSNLAVVVFPSLVLLHQQDMVEVKKFSNRLFLIMGGLGILVMLLFLVVLPQIIRWWLPNYLEAIVTVQILALAIPAIFLHVPLSQVLLSSDKYLKHILALSVVPVSFNILLNLIFIPQYGYIAAAWVTVFSDCFSLGLLLLVLKRTVYRE